MLLFSEQPRETVRKVSGEVPRGHISLACDGKKGLRSLVRGAVGHQIGCCRDFSDSLRGGILRNLHSPGRNA